MTFAEIFTEYYTLYRGQGTNIPTFGDREFTIGIQLANSAIKKWERGDGTLWRELQVRLQTASDGVKTVSTGVTSYAAPTDMRKPPAAVRMTLGDAGFDVPVIEPQEKDQMTDDSTYAYFEGSANTGYTMKIPTGLASQHDGWAMDYVYTKKATLIPTTPDPSAVEVEMSDPTFIIQEMLAIRYQQSRNPYFKIAKGEANTALQNMKIENNSGTYGKPWKLTDQGGWGKTTPRDDFVL